MKPPLYFEEFKQILSKITFRDWTLKAFQKEECYLLQWTFMEKDTTKPEDDTLYEQHCRKWYISQYSTQTEIIRTAWLAVQQAIIHEASESFLYNGVRLFDPHTDYVSLSEYMAGATQDVRD
jgi:hypothetical protein